MIKFNPIKNIIYNDLCTVKVGYRESLILSILLDRSPNIVPKQDIICHAWGSKYIGVTSLSKSISILRQSFVKLGMKDSPIITVPKVGYRLVNKDDIQSVIDEEVSKFQPIKVEKSEPKPRSKRVKLWVNTTASFLLLLSSVLFFSGKERFDLSLINVEEKKQPYKSGNLELFIKSKSGLNNNLIRSLKEIQCDCVIYLFNNKNSTSVALYNKSTKKSVNIFIENDKIDTMYSKIKKYLDNIARDV